MLFVKDRVRAAAFFGECVSACACARKPLLTEAQGVASCSRDRTGPSGYNQNKEAHWGKHNKNISPSAAFALKGNLQLHLNSAVFQQRCATF